MIINLFKNLSDTRWFAAIAILLIMFIPFDYHFTNHDFSFTLLQDFKIESWFSIDPTLFLSIVIILFTIFSATLFFFMLMRNKLIPSRNYTGLFYSIILIIVWHPDIISYSNLITLAFLQFGLFKALSMEESANPQLAIFDSSFIISIACVLNVYLTPYILIPFLALLHFRVFHLRIWTSAFVGIFLPLLIINSLAYFIHGSFSLFTMLAEIFNSIKPGIAHIIQHPIHWAVAGLVMIPAIIRTLSLSSEKKIVIRKKTILLVWFFLFACTLLFLDQAPPDITIYLLAFPAGFFISSSFVFLSEKKLFSFIIDLVCIGLIVLNCM